MPFELAQEIGLIAKAAFEADDREGDVGFQNQMLGLLQFQFGQVGVVGFSYLLFELCGKIIGVEMNVRRRGIQGWIFAEMGSQIKNRFFNKCILCVVPSLERCDPENAKDAEQHQLDLALDHFNREAFFSFVFLGYDIGNGENA